MTALAEALWWAGQHAAGIGLAIFVGGIAVSLAREELVGR